MTRPDWDTYFFRIASKVAQRSTCPRASVGVVIAKDNRVLSTGYNGAPPGEEHCIDVGCLMVDDHCKRTIHAEANAIAQAAKYGVSIDGATLYCWSNIPIPVCSKCEQFAKAAGITTIYKSL